MMQTPANMGTDIMRFARLDMREVAELHIEGEARVVDHLRGRNGAVRAGALLTMLDSAGGVCGGLASLPDGWVVSTNLCARTVHHAPTGPLVLDSRVLRKGRNNVVTAVEIADAATGALVMDGVLTSAILVPENGPPVWERPLRIGYPGERRLPVDGPLARCPASSTRTRSRWTCGTRCATRGASCTAVSPPRSSTRASSTRPAAVASPTSCCTTSHRTGPAPCAPPRRSSAAAPTAPSCASSSRHRRRPRHRGRDHDRRVRLTLRLSSG